MQEADGILQSVKQFKRQDELDLPRTREALCGKLSISAIPGTKTTDLNNTNGVATISVLETLTKLSF